MWLPDISERAGPKYLAIANAIVEAIEKGEIFPGQKLPPHRELAYQMGVSVQTVFRAYAELERRRLAIGEVGRGTYIQYFDPDSVSEFIVDKGSENLIDMSTMAPVVSHLHTKSLAKAFREIADDPDLIRLLAHRPIVGSSLHRAAGTMWLKQLGVVAETNNVIIVNGAQHGIHVALTAIVEPGDAIACASLVDSTVITIADVLKLKLISLEVDDDGILPTALEDACGRHGVRALCLTPNLNNPTTTVMSAARRRDIAVIAEKRDLWIVEDDVFGPLLSRRPKPIQSLLPERTCYATSFSKSVMHSLRTGYLVGPTVLIDSLVSRLRTTGWMSNPISAEIAMRWIYDRTIEKLIVWQRKELQARHKLVKGAVKGMTYRAHLNAHHVWFELPGGLPAAEFVAAVRAKRLLVTGPNPFVAGRQGDVQGVRLTIGDSVRSREELRRGLSLLRSAFDALGSLP